MDLRMFVSGIYKLPAILPHEQLKIEHMKFKVGENVKLLTENRIENLIVLKSKVEEITEYNIDSVIGKSNIKNIKDKISNIDLGNFDYLLVHSFPSPFPIDIDSPKFEFAFEDDLTNS